VPESIGSSEEKVQDPTEPSEESIRSRKELNLGMKIDYASHGAGKKSRSSKNFCQSMSRMIFCTDEYYLQYIVQRSVCHHTGNE
jgi:hypothetical protein